VLAKTLMRSKCRELSSSSQRSPAGALGARASLRLGAQKFAHRALPRGRERDPLSVESGLDLEASRRLEGIAYGPPDRLSETLTLRRSAFNRAARAGSPADAAMIDVASQAGKSITGNLMTKAW
jgi:hypothetical protein